MGLDTEFYLLFGQQAKGDCLRNLGQYCCFEEQSVQNKINERYTECRLAHCVRIRAATGSSSFRTRMRQLCLTLK